jgi:predicted acyl esterase
MALCVWLAPAASAGTEAPFEARGSAKQVYATGLNPNAKATLERRGNKLRTQRANELGGVLFRKVEPGGGYRVRSGGAKSPKLRVLTERSAPPDESVYDQEVKDDGYGYMTMRDGTKLAYYTHPAEDVATALPGDIDLPPLLPGPRPTLIEYAGYGYADPAGPESGISLIGNLMGFNVVNVNMRGTGCSGGAFDFFEPLQSLDGYDIVETVARQPWVKNDQVGLMGISYGGISQLFVGATRPPSLAAITPISLLDQVQTTLFPGGILNTGFALEWAKDRIREARPATANEDEGQRWAWKRIQEGDTTCAENQVMHGEAVDLLRKIRNNNTYKPRVADPLSPATFVDEINVPTFAACQWQDEQTGGHCANMADRFTGTDKKWFTFTNGTHVDSLAPETFNRWFDFLNIYVAEQPPALNPFRPVVQAAAPLVYEEAMGISGATLPHDPIQDEPTLAGAQAAFEAQKPVRILFENGSGRDPGHPYPGFEQSFDSLPVPGTQARTWFVTGDGELGGARPQGKKRKSFKADPRSTQPTNFTGDTGSGGLWTAFPDYHWDPHPDGTAASFVTDPLEQDTTVIGAGKVELQVRSARRDVDLQATISEVRPDDKEVFVQGGWVRASMRKLDKQKSSNLEPVLSLRKKHVEPMPRGRFTKVTIPLYYEGHAYRADSRIKVTISGVHGDQPIWAFDRAKPRNGKTKVTISSSRRKPSRLVLPVVPGVDVPDELPPCPGLRAQPCRAYDGG